MEWFIGLNSIQQALIATLFTWFVTALGAAGVFLFKRMNQYILNSMLGFGAGVMIAASFWSLLAPSIEMSKELGIVEWVPPLIGFVLGCTILMGIDFWLARKIKKSNKVHRSLLLTLAITLHNIPEGLAVGVAFGAVTLGIQGATLATAVALAIGIGLQNFPEGAAVSIPLRREGFSRKKSFLIGQASALVEPIAGVIGAALAYTMRSILPYALSFAAGAMVYVVIEELVPESQKNNYAKLATIGFMVGFAIMMTLDVSLG
ncbi:ZIP family metal transporter [Mycoplasmatota bacterium zrk1]